MVLLVPGGPQTHKTLPFPFLMHLVCFYGRYTPVLCRAVSVKNGLFGRFCTETAYRAGAAIPGVSGPALGISSAPCHWDRR